MHSLRELYKFGNGPSSSHTIGPERAANLFVAKYKDLDFIKVTLYGSLALTGKGHLTDYIIDKTLNKIPHQIQFNFFDMPTHPNTMVFEGYKEKELIAKATIYSVGGGSIRVEGEPLEEIENVYPHKHLFEIKEYCLCEDIELAQYVYRFDTNIKEHLEKALDIMLDSINRGINAKGTLHGDLHVIRKAYNLYHLEKDNETKIKKHVRIVSAYAYAVSEENASGGLIVTAPTCGAAGVLPAVIKTVMDENGVSRDKIIDALAVAGLFGNIVKFNASISGAEAGCQAEIGTACAMAAAFLATIYGLPLEGVAQAAEIALEHHLGLTCDPIRGYVQIPCIERNAVAALRAFDAASLASMLDSSESKISFDLICKTMLETGKDLGESYRETSKGGLAGNYK